VVIRAASRTEPPDSGGQLQLDFGKGVVIQRNVAGTGMERLRKVLPASLMQRLTLGPRTLTLTLTRTLNWRPMPSPECVSTSAPTVMPAM